MTFLAVLWFGSLILAAVSIALMLVLVARRYVQNRREVRRQEEKKAITRQVIAFLEEANENAVTEILSQKGAIYALPELAGHLLRMTRGEDQSRVIDLLRRTGAMDRLIKASHNRRLHTRLEAVETLSFFDEPAALAALRRRLEDHDDQVQIAAGIGLARHDALPPIRQLIEQLHIEPGHASRRFRALFRALVPQNADELAELLLSDAPEAAIPFILDALGRSGDYKVLPALIEMTTHPNEEIRIAALRALEKLGHPGARVAVIARLRDKAWTVRAQAAQWCGRIGLREAVDVLELLLHDSQWWVRYRAAEALARLGPAGWPALKRAALLSTENRRLARAVLFESMRPL